MDEINLVTALRPDPPAEEEAAAMRAAAGRRLAGVLAGRGLRSASRRTRLLIACGAVAAGVTAATVVPAVLPGRSGGPLVSKAWAVERGNDGTVKLTVSQVFSDLSGLQATLRADGVPAIVAVIPWTITHVNGGTRAIQSCAYESLQAAPAPVQATVITHPVTRMYQAYGQSATASPEPMTLQPAGLGPDPFAWIIHPGAMPPGSVLFIQASPTLDSRGIGGSLSDPLVLRTSRLPACVPGSGRTSEWHSGWSG